MSQERDLKFHAAFAWLAALAVTVAAWAGF
jgi:hypothetical protein